MMRKRVTKAVLTLVGGYVTILVVAHVWAHETVTHRPCPPTGARLLVDTNAHVMCLCRDGRVEGMFRVALGRRGLDKRIEGDGRTPLGAYPLGVARRSGRYAIFIPVGYPTQEQKRSGYIGGDIGIHGPHIGFAWLRHATVWVNWTRGCIAVATAAEAERVAAWIRMNGPTDVLVT